MCRRFPINNTILHTNEWQAFQEWHLPIQLYLLQCTNFLLYKLQNGTYKISHACPPNYHFFTWLFFGGFFFYSAPLFVFYDYLRKWSFFFCSISILAWRSNFWNSGKLILPSLSMSASSSTLSIDPLNPVYCNHQNIERKG